MPRRTPAQVADDRNTVSEMCADLSRDLASDVWVEYPRPGKVVLFARQGKGLAILCATRTSRDMADVLEAMSFAALRTRLLYTSEKEV